MNKVIRFPDKPRASISIWESPHDGGSWAVDLTSPYGDSVGILGFFRSIFDAQAAARQWATELDADYADHHRREVLS